MHANPAAGSYALALKGGELISVHAAKLAEPGTKLRLPLRQLANGTFAEDGVAEEEGRSTKATFHGTVSFVDADPAAPAYTVSGRGASILVRLRADSGESIPQLPALGSYVTVTAKVENPPATAEDAPPEAAAEPTPPLPSCAPDLASTPIGKPEAVLWQSKVEVEGQPTTYLDLAGTLSGVCPDTGQLLLSADDARESEKDLTLAVPPKIAIGKLKVGDSFLATATVEPDGSLTLAGIAGDERTKGADDDASAQGDLKR